MTYEEAIAMIKNDMKLHHDYLSGTYRKALNTAVEALEKQIPKKPKDETKSFAYCPHCCGSVFKANIREHIEGKEITFCEHCGQALDWSEEE